MRGGETSGSWAVSPPLSHRNSAREGTVWLGGGFALLEQTKNSLCSWVMLWGSSRRRAGASLGPPMPLWDPLKYPPLSLQCSGQIYFPLTLTPGILGWLGMPAFPTCCKAKRLCSKSPVASRLRFSLARDYIYAGIFLVCANIQSRMISGRGKGSSTLFFCGSALTAGCIYQHLPDITVTPSCCRAGLSPHCVVCSQG